MDDRMVKALSTVHTALYKATGGLIGTRLVNNDMLLLTTTGRTTGERHTVPLLFLRDNDDYIVIASYGGRPSDPDWYRNLSEHPDAVIRDGSKTVQVAAATLTVDQREAWWPRIVAAYGDYAVYQSRTTRLIPIVRLSPTM